MSVNRDVNLVSPMGPPPPQLPPGWIARWDPRYSTFYFVDLSTKQSQWEKPSIPSSPSLGVQADTRPLPYSASKSTSAVPQSSSRKPQSQLYSSLVSPSTNQQYPAHISQNSGTESSASPSPQPSEKRGSFTAKLHRFFSSHVPSPRPHSSHYSPTSTHGLPLQLQPYYGSGGFYSVPPPTMLYPPPSRRAGMGAGGAAALGAGGGLLGGMLLADALDNDYVEGFADGADYGGDYGGKDFGGMDF
ncbi:hypothetical protein BDZ91DRAFT_722417 [Kalaharituber pfeilii]|nr:hypothetical protein BDZ91DRAFT_722417 [Kalaharituber pfeilii]